MCRNNGPTMPHYHFVTWPPEIKLFSVDKMIFFGLCTENRDNQWKCDKKCNTIQNPQTSKTQRRHVQLPTRRVEEPILEWPVLIKHFEQLVDEPL